MSFISVKTGKIFKIIGFILWFSTFVFLILGCENLLFENFLSMILSIISLAIMGELFVATGDMMKMIIKMRAELDQVNQKTEQIESKE